ncbi:MAG TPA: hypothetical protein VNO84_03920 [Burkholderiaceae bacterium]|nr:hypothetical protein [Burkholderiaceae bacterium]
MKRPTWFAGCVLALGTLGAAPAMAGDVYWSIGVHSPGVSTTISNARPAVVYPAPTVVYPAPTVVYPAPAVVYPTPRALYSPPPVMYAPRPVYVHPAPVVVYPGHGKKWHKHEYKREGWRGDRRHGWHD